MPPTLVKLDAILIPNRRDYVRGSVDPRNLDAMRAAADGQKWPFPPILLRALEKPVKRKKTEYSLRLVDGMHRTLLARELKMVSIPAEVEKMSDQAEMVAQLRTNLVHGQRLDPKHRNRWVLHLTDQKMTYDQIAKLLKYSRRQVIRMANEAKGKPAAQKRKRQEEKDEIAAKGEKPAEVTFTPQVWFEHFFAVAETGSKHQPALIHFLETDEKTAEAFATGLGLLGALRRV